MTTLSPLSPPAFPSPTITRDSRLDSIQIKLNRSIRLSLEDGRILYDTGDIWSVLSMADSLRRRFHGDKAYYNINRHLIYSNVCALSCKFCDFYAKQGDAKAYTRDISYIQDQAREAIENGATEMHIVGVLHPYLPFSYYTDMLRSIKAVAPNLHLKAFTAVELVHLAKISKIYKNATGSDDSAITARREAIKFILSELQAAGLGSLTGGGGADNNNAGAGGFDISGILSKLEGGIRAVCIVVAAEGAVWRTKIRVVAQRFG